MRNCCRISVKLMLDENGEVWSSGGSALRKHFNSRLTNNALCDYLITNIGWISLERACDKVVIRCRPAYVTERARAALYYYLFDQRCCSMTVQLLGEVWQQFDLRSKSNVMDLLEGMANGAGKTGSSMTAIQHKPSESPLHEFWTAINQLSGKSPSLDSYASAVTTISPNQRWTISHFDDGDQLVLDRKGLGFTPFNWSWTNNEQALSLIEYAGSEYADWIARMRRSVARSSAVVYDEVDATLNFPSMGLTRFCYYRVTGAVNLGNKQPHVLSMAVAKASLECR